MKKSITKLTANMAILLGLGMVSSLVPWLHYGLILGFPAVITNVFLIGVVFRKQLSK